MSVTKTDENLLKRKQRVKQKLQNDEKINCEGEKIKKLTKLSGKGRRERNKLVAANSQVAPANFLIALMFR